MSDLLGTRRGRLAAFFLLYLTEGVPQGFASIAVATQMRRQGLGPKEVGLFVASLYLPWGWKWLVGPVVDLVYSDRVGKRRGWIVGCQLLMTATLLAAFPVDFVTQLQLFTAIILIHNVFAATQDVAIDALAVTTLPESERGTANGLMFAGAYTGAALGGAGVLYLSEWTGTFAGSFWGVAGVILFVTFFVSMRLKERRPTPPVLDLPEKPQGDAAAGDAVPTDAKPGDTTPRSLNHVLGYFLAVLKAMFGTRRSIAGLAFALLPTGAYGLSLALASNLSVEFGLSDGQIANLTVIGTILAAAGCIAGGFLSDRFGRRRMLLVYILLTLPPTLLLAYVMQQNGWIMPIDLKAANHRTAPQELVTAFVVLSLAFGLVQGLIWGSRTAGYMDLCNPAVAATQFTAYMSVMNLTLSYSSLWMGESAAAIGYPATLTIDAAAGLLCLIPLAFLRPASKTE